MNDLQIEYFLAAARNMSFSKAAQELFTACHQPADPGIGTRTGLPAF